MRREGLKESSVGEGLSEFSLASSALVGSVEAVVIESSAEESIDVSASGSASMGDSSGMALGERLANGTGVLLPLLPGRESGRGKLDDVGLKTRFGRRRGRPLLASAIFKGETWGRPGDDGGLEVSSADADELRGRGA